MHVICAFWFLRGVGCLQVNGQLVKSPFYIPYSSVCLVFICWWCFRFLSVSQSLSILQFSQIIHVNVCLVRSRDSYPTIGYIIHHVSFYIPLCPCPPSTPTAVSDRGDVAEVAKEKL